MADCWCGLNHYDSDSDYAWDGDTDDTSSSVSAA
jgi:hypothetical protein